MDTFAERVNSVEMSRIMTERVDILFFHVTILGTVAFGVCMVGLEIAKFVMGIIYLDDCELQPLLPVELIVEFCLVLMFIVILVSIHTVDRNKTCVSSMILFLILLVVWLTMLLLIFGNIVGTVWVVNVREEIYAAGHCNYTTTTPPIVTTSTSNFTFSQSTPNPASLGGSLSSFSTTTNPNEAETKSAAISHCSTCDKTFINFTFGVVITQWIIIGIVFLIRSCMRFITKSDRERELERHLRRGRESEGQR